MYNCSTSTGSSKRLIVIYNIHLLWHFGANIPMMIIIHVVIGTTEVNIHYRMLGVNHIVVLCVAEG